MPFVALPGFRDVYPDALARRRRVFDAWRRVAARYGFEEYDGPPLEPLELYTAKSGEEIVAQLYAFEDKGGRPVALRPEMTPTLARMVGARAAQLKKPIRWFSIPQLFRYERQQRGRLREHFQLNADIVGEPGPGADAEVIAVAVDVMRVLGLGPRDVQVRLSDRAVVCAAARRYIGLADDAQLLGVLAGLDRRTRDPEAAAAQFDRALGGQAGLVAKAVEFATMLEGPDAGSFIAGLVARGQPADLYVGGQLRLDRCVDLLGAMGLAEFVVRDFSIVRGLAYYTGIVFEVFDARRELRAICGGGRYDQLIAALGGPDLPCVGFGMGDVVLGELLAEREGGSAAAPIDVFIALVREEERPAALALARALRDRDVRVEYALRRQAVGKQLELANARGAAWAVVLGPDEFARGEAVVRSLRTGAESRVGLEELRERFAFTSSPQVP